MAAKALDKCGHCFRGFVYYQACITVILSMTIAGVFTETATTENQPVIGSFINLTAATIAPANGTTTESTTTNSSLCVSDVTESAPVSASLTERPLIAVSVVAALLGLLAVGLGVWGYKERRRNKNMRVQLLTLPPSANTLDNLERGRGISDLRQPMIPRAAIISMNSLMSGGDTLNDWGQNGQGDEDDYLAPLQHLTADNRPTTDHRVSDSSNSSSGRLSWRHKVNSQARTGSSREEKDESVSEEEYDELEYVQPVRLMDGAGSDVQIEEQEEECIYVNTEPTYNRQSQTSYVDMSCRTPLNTNSRAAGPPYHSRRNKGRQQGTGAAGRPEIVESRQDNDDEGQCDYENFTVN